MKKIYSLAATLTLIVLLSACLKDKLTRTYTIYEPVLRDRAEVLAAIKSSPAKTVERPGKIYLYGNYIFLNELNKGVHIIDNSDPSHPQIKAFIEIPGNVDIAVKGNMLYADLFTDMVAIDIADPLNVSLSKVVRNLFPERTYGSPAAADSNKVIVDWIERKVTASFEVELEKGCPNCASLSATGSGGPMMSVASPSIGMGGSMARFAIVNNYLYAVSRSKLEVVDINNPGYPVHVADKYTGWTIETIYPFKQKLFIGTTTGMIIYNISNPANPTEEGMFAHARACDPVVADDRFAYVTLRAGNFCQGTNNQLDVVDIQNILAPSLVKTYSMSNPWGLGKDGNTLFICDGWNGLKVYDASNISDLRLIKHIQTLETYDVIANNKKLLVV